MLRPRIRLQETKTVTALNLSGNKLGNDGAAALAGMLKVGSAVLFFAPPNCSMTGVAGEQEHCSSEPARQLHLRQRRDGPGCRHQGSEIRVSLLARLHCMTDKLEPYEP